MASSRAGNIGTFLNLTNMPQAPAKAPFDLEAMSKQALVLIKDGMRDPLALQTTMNLSQPEMEQVANYLRSAGMLERDPDTLVLTPFALSALDLFTVA
jgi:DNA-binding transcriptional MocR family regulator